MTIQYKDVADLKEYENNPRNNDTAVDFVAESIENFGFKVPIIIDGNNVIVAGHTRFKAANKLNLKQIPCIVADDLSDEQIKAFRLADNMVAEKAEWDFTLLVDELQGLNCDLELTGFEEWELDSILNPMDEGSLQDFYEDAEVKEKEPEKLQCPCCGEWFEV